LIVSCFASVETVFDSTTASRSKRAIR
jgi:hypothetical protein